MYAYERFHADWMSALNWLKQRFTPTPAPVIPCQPPPKLPQKLEILLNTSGVEGSFVRLDGKRIWHPYEIELRVHAEDLGVIRISGFEPADPEAETLTAAGLKVNSDRSDLARYYYAYKVLSVTAEVEVL